jgi:hypothetical protein
MRNLIVVCAFVLVGTEAVAQDRVPAGHIKLVAGSVTILRAGTAVAAQPGVAVFETDAIRTGADGKVGITLQDDTRISLGPTSELKLDRFSYAPAEGRLAVVLKFVRGIAAYVSGRIATLSPDAVRLETPAAIVGVRGTTLAIRADVK